MLEIHGALARGAFAVAVLVSLAVLFAPAGSVPAAAPGVDKIVHGIVFLALAATGRWAGIRAVVLAPVLVVYGAVTEVLQATTPLSRSGSVADWLADLVGLALGLGAWVVGERLQRSRRGA